MLYLNSLDLYQAENQVFKPSNLFVIVGGGGKTGPAHSFPPPSSFDLLLIVSSFGLCYCFTLFYYLWKNYTKVRIKFSIQQDYWYFYIVGWGKTGPAFLSPPSIMLGSFNLLFSLSVYVTLWLYLNNFEWPIPKRDQIVNWYFYIVGWGKTGLAHSFPPPKCWDLSIYPLDFWIMLFFCCIWTPLTYTEQRNKFSNQQVHL